MNLIIWLVIGGLIGWIASIMMRTDAQQGVLLNVVVGIVGAMLAGFLLTPVLGSGTINSGNFSLTLSWARSCCSPSSTCSGEARYARASRSSGSEASEGSPSPADELYIPYQGIGRHGSVPSFFALGSRGRRLSPFSPPTGSIEKGRADPKIRPTR
jgi:uncharacterized membrane protein YeaQ/YmgE (transglycosylase-associated protein family)